MTSGSDLPAEILDDCLGRILERKATVGDCLRAHPAAGPELRSLLETAIRARDFLAPVGLSPEAVIISEARLRRKLRDLKTAGSPLRAAQPQSGIWAFLRTAAFAVLTIILLGSGVGVFSVSAQALPGDALYPAKIDLERINLAVSFTPAGDVNLLMQYSDRRVEEIRRLVGENRDQDLAEGFDQYQETLILLEAAMQKLPADSESGILAEVQTRLSDQAEVLSSLRPLLPVQAQELLDYAVGRSVESQDLIQNIRQGKGPVNTPPGQLKKETKQPDHPNPGGGKPVSTEEPTRTRKEPKSNPSTPKPKPVK